ncbi:hypothetical protein LSAT2_024751 [Lamellibrachia satsuma]|nr:hypothetical protein LSAT2_024751 [Lamellibrachia satsuma]
MKSPPVLTRFTRPVPTALFDGSCRQILLAPSLMRHINFACRDCATTRSNCGVNWRRVASRMNTMQPIACAVSRVVTSTTETHCRTWSVIGTTYQRLLLFASRDLRQSHPPYNRLDFTRS